MIISFVGAFAAGVVSFLSPCVLPLLPGFLAYLAGGQGSDAKRGQIFLNSLFFVLGFSIIFAVLGVLLNTALKGVSFEVQLWLARVGGLVVIFFGLYLAGLIRVGFLERDYKMKVESKGTNRSRYITSFLFGLAFAAGWTPCVGPALGAIIGLAAAAPGQAFALFLIYALGLGIPFLIVGAFTAQATVFISRYANTFTVITKVFGVILIILGVLVFTQSLTLLGNVLPVQWVVNKV